MARAAGRRAWLGILGLVLLWAVLEAFALLASWLAAGKPLDFSEPSRVHAALRGEIEALRASPALEALAPEIIHPYLGFVGNPLQVAAPGEGVPPRNAFGFADAASPIRPRDPRRFRVALVGGSVAERFGGFGAERFEARLAAAPVLAGRRVELVRLGQSGYKQPQQLLGIVWLLSLGAHFDAVIALDGFNEVALHGAENARQGVEPSFPRNWALRVGGLPDPAALAERGRVARLDRARAAWAGGFARAPLRWSPVAQVVWRWRERSLLAERLGAEAFLRAHRPSEDRYAVRGPAYFDDAEVPLARLVEIWEQSARQLHRVAQGNGALFVQFLQPNQYFPDTKPMGDAERGVAIREDHLYRPGAEAGYPLLLAAGARLRAAGVHFDDASTLFRDVPEAVFVDDCCHMNLRGHELLADHMAAGVAAALAR